MTLRAIPPEVYVREVLPHTAPLWSGGRTFDVYVANTLALASSPYGKRGYRTVGFFEGNQLLASCKRYDRTLRHRNNMLRALGIGAVYTNAEFRGRGYATAMLASLLDHIKGTYDLAYLYSDIHPSFYEALGFVQCPSRAISFRLSSLQTTRVSVTRIAQRDWQGIRRCFDYAQTQRPWSLQRDTLLWNWMRTQIESPRLHGSCDLTNLVIKSSGSVLGYVFGARSVGSDAYILDEFGYANEEARELIPSLLSNAAGDLRRITGWLPPDGARELLPRGSVRARKDAILMMAPLSAKGRRLVELATTPSGADGTWNTDHI